MTPEEMIAALLPVAEFVTVIESWYAGNMWELDDASHVCVFSGGGVTVPLLIEDLRGARRVFVSLQAKP